MSRRVRLAVFGTAAVGVGVLLVLAFLAMPAFGGHDHPYRDLAVPASVLHGTANAVSGVNFDQRGLDTMAEESIMIASVLAVATILRKSDDEEHRKEAGGRVLDSTVLVGWILLPATILLGLDVIAHGHLTPGGGFQGGIVAGTAIHLLYVAGSYRTLERVRPVRVFEWLEAVGTGAYVCVGIAGVLVATAFLQNVLAYGTFGTLFSSGTVGLLNGAVGLEVGSGMVVVVSRFLDQAVGIRPKRDGHRRREEKT